MVSEKAKCGKRDGGPAPLHSLVISSIFYHEPTVKYYYPPPTPDCQVHFPKIFISVCGSPVQKSPGAPRTASRKKIKFLPNGPENISEFISQRTNALSRLCTSRELWQNKTGNLAPEQGRHVLSTYTIWAAAGDQRT